MARSASSGGALSTYRAKRRFHETPEPKGRLARRKGQRYLIQKHDARRLHYDFRLELDGVLKSWAVTKGPSLDPADKRLAVRTEDHPLSYGDFEGQIPAGNYGAGTVMLWDEGTWEPDDDPRRGLEKGKLNFRIEGRRLKGRWALVRMRPRKGEKKENWLLIKRSDSASDPDADLTAEETTSVRTGRGLEDIAADEAASGKPARPAARSNVRRKPLPGFVAPELATLVDHVPKGPNWVFELKHDGYRAIAAVSGEEVRIYTRNQLDWTARYPAIARALAGLDLDGALLDGEIVVVDEKGRSDFGALQRALKGEGGGVLSFFVFDLLADGGKSLREKPLVERKARLKALLGGGREGPVFYSDHLETGGDLMPKDLCRRGFEGLIAKRGDRPYRSGRGRDWVKVKCGREQEFVIVGWSPSTRGRPFSSLLLGLHENGKLCYAGRVGTGFSEEMLADLAKRFRALARDTPTVKADLPPYIARKVHWVEPRLVAQVAFSEFTSDGIVRQGRFVGLREDKPAKAVGREEPAHIGRARK